MLIAIIDRFYSLKYILATWVLIAPVWPTVSVAAPPLARSSAGFGSVSSVDPSETARGAQRRCAFWPDVIDGKRTVQRPSQRRRVKLSLGRLLTGGERSAELFPLYRVQPDYPASAANQGVEGWVAVEFTIGPTGTVKNARVVQASPGNTFSQSALRAVQKWVYRPRIRDGRGIETPGVRVLLRFRLEDA